MSEDAPNLESLLAKAEAYLDLPDNGDGWDDLEREKALDELESTAAAVVKNHPALKMRAKLICTGAKQLRANRKNCLQNGGQNGGRNIRLAIECVKRRRDAAAHDQYSDSELMALVGNRVAGLGRSSAIAAIKSAISHPLVQVEIRKSGDRRNPNGRRSIFNDSKELNADV